MLGIAMHNTTKKTPKDTTEFEREQLRFFLGECDVIATLAEINPSLAWLPVLSDLKLIDARTELTSWIEKNFADINAVREVAANISFFGMETADILDFRLNQAEGLPSLLVKCWRLIIIHMRNTKRSALRNDWFEIERRIKRGEHSPELLYQIAHVLQPRLRVSKRLPWGEEVLNNDPERPTDLISIDFEIEDYLTGDEVLSAWPENVQPDLDEKLLNQLTLALGGAIENAVESGVESSLGYSLSDADVPSVAKHEQNANRAGFLPIVRVTADLWTRLARKDAQRALAFIEKWQASEFRLFTRLAVFAAADSAVPSDMAVQILMELPARDLFLANSSVEVYRLIKARWSDFAPDKQQAIERRILEGPPATLFRREQEQMIDSCRFELFTHLERGGAKLGKDSQAVLDDIRNRWPAWEVRPEEQAGFHSWIGEVRGISDDPTKLSAVPDSDLINVAEKVSAEAGFMGGDSWQALCQSDAARALRGLASQAEVGKWPVWAWRPFLWAATKLPDISDVQLVAELLLKWPKDDIPEIAEVASWWLNEKANTLHAKLLWPIWDRIAEASFKNIEETKGDDGLSTSLNSSSGRLAEVLLKKLTKGLNNRELTKSFRARLDKLITAKGQFGFLARVRLAAEVSLLFDNAPEWTSKNIIPLFDWSSPDAPASWSARKYARYIGSPELFGLTKQPFMELFKRANVAEEELRVFSEWLVAIMIANQSKQADYPIKPAEARSALRQAGVKSLSSVGHRLAIEMTNAKLEEKIAKWRSVVGPVFQSIWPLDVELQTSASTFKLVQILRESGAAFPEAAEVIIPYVRSESSQSHTSIYSISEADDILYSSSPEKILDLIIAVVGDTPPKSAFGLRKVLDRIRKHAPQLVNSRKFQKLLSISEY